MAFSYIFPGKDLFPSPCGEKVGINLTVRSLRLASPTQGKFPSPCGEKVGINLQFNFSDFSEYLL